MLVYPNCPKVSRMGLFHGGMPEENIRKKPMHDCRGRLDMLW